MRNKATKKNMDLDLRRYGKMLYTKAEESGGSDGGEGGGSTEVDYEAIYQFYKKKIIKNIPEEYLEHVIIPEHYADVEVGEGNSGEYRDKISIWYSTERPVDVTDLFCEIETNKYIYFGSYKYHEK